MGCPVHQFRSSRRGRTACCGNIRSRIDYSNNVDLSRFKMYDVLADEIWLWNMADNVTKRIKIPQIEYAPTIVCYKFIRVSVYSC